MCVENKIGDFYFTLSCPVEAKVLKHIRTFVVSIAEDIGFDDENIAKIELAVDEICTNVIKHAYDNKKQGKIYICIKIFDNALKIIVSDKGKGMKIEDVHKQKDIKKYTSSNKYGGLGTYIASNFMDKVIFHSVPDKGTTVEMVKFLGN